MRFIECSEDKPCFAQMLDIYGKKRCRILTEKLLADTCPFRKNRADITDGKRYPYNPEYVGANKEWRR